jgi:peptide/nickel transport system permease protein
MAPNAVYTAGDVSVAGRLILKDGQVVRAGSRDAVMDIRWTRVSIIFQSAMNALNPVLTVRQQLMEAYRLHRPAEDEAAAVARIEALFDLIGIPRRRMTAYPHELSGGMRQRVMIALSLLHEPDLVIADEPTTALDVLIQDQILGEIDALRRRLGLGLILISHDMGAVAETCDRVAVMYAGEIVEIAPTSVIFGVPRHPYTRALMGALPTVTGPKRPLETLAGEPFTPTGDIVGCRFAPRCAMATDRCRAEAPAPVAVAADHLARCHYARDDARIPA